MEFADTNGKRFGGLNKLGPGIEGSQLAVRGLAPQGRKFSVFTTPKIRFLYHFSVPDQPLPVLHEQSVETLQYIFCIFLCIYGLLLVGLACSMYTRSGFVDVFFWEEGIFEAFHARVEKGYQDQVRDRERRKCGSLIDGGRGILDHLCHQNAHWFLHRFTFCGNFQHSFNALVCLSPRGAVKGLKEEEIRGHVRVAVFSTGRTEGIGHTSSRHPPRHLLFKTILLGVVF